MFRPHPDLGPVPPPPPFLNPFHRGPHPPGPFPPGGMPGIPGMPGTPGMPGMPEIQRLDPYSRGRRTTRRLSLMNHPNTSGSLNQHELRQAYKGRHPRHRYDRSPSTDASSIMCDRLAAMNLGGHGPRFEPGMLDRAPPPRRWSLPAREWPLPARDASPFPPPRRFDWSSRFRAPFARSPGPRGVPPRFRRPLGGLGLGRDRSPPGRRGRYREPRYARDDLDFDPRYPDEDDLGGWSDDEDPFDELERLSEDDMDYFGDYDGLEDCDELGFRPERYPGRRRGRY